MRPAQLAETASSRPGQDDDPAQVESDKALAYFLRFKRARQRRGQYVSKWRMPRREDE